MNNKIIELVDTYWKFDDDQYPMSSWHDKQDLLEELRKLLEISKENNSVPEWLTNDVRSKAELIWNEHVDYNDNKRVEAIRLIQRAALDAGYSIQIYMAMELFQKHCLHLTNLK